MGDKIYYRGTPIEEMPREELIKALKESCEQTRQERESHQRSMRALSNVEIANVQRSDQEEWPSEA